VILLNSMTRPPEQLDGGGGAPPAIGDALATRALVKGEAVSAAAGRADDFSWPPRAPNTKLSEPLPPSGAPVNLAVAPAPKAAEPAPQTASGPGGARVAGQPVLQGQIQPQRPFAPPPGWRSPPFGGYGGGFYDRPRGLFGLFR
jgi:hypothetical protein